MMVSNPRAINPRRHGNRPMRAMLASSIATITTSAGGGKLPRIRIIQSRALSSSPGAHQLTTIPPTTDRMTIATVNTVWLEPFTRGAFIEAFIFQVFRQSRGWGHANGQVRLQRILPITRNGNSNARMAGSQDTQYTLHPGRKLKCFGSEGQRTLGIRQ